MFILELLENVTAQTQAYSIGRNYDGQGVYGGGTGTIDPMRRTLLSGGGGVFGPGAHTAVITLCTFESYPCGDGIDDEVLEQVTFEFNIRE